MSDEYLIDFCSPTLASLKTGSLFNSPYESEEKLQQWLAAKNCELNPRGIHLLLLRRCSKHALIYVYRPTALVSVLKGKEVQAFLRECGYPAPGNMDLCLSLLKQRTADCSPPFPHEIGIFLGYPLYDVQCFIRFHGQGCRKLGLWQVYGNVEECNRCFIRYQKCTSVYRRSWSLGRSVVQLTVAG